MNPGNIIAIVVIVLVVALVSWPIFKKMKSRETCCGTKREKMPSKRLKHVEGKYELSVEGMHCANCVRQVTNAVNAMDGLSAKVSLEKNRAVISYETEPKQEEAIKAIQELGFFTTGV